MNTKKTTIFLADDDDDDRSLFAEALNSIHTDFNFHSVNNGEKVIHFFKEVPSVPDFIFLDINMPKADGVECLRHIKSLYPSNTFHVIMLSTALSSKSVELCYRYGASLYIQKPTRFNNLITFIRYCIFELKNSSVQDHFILNERLNIRD